MNVVRPLPISTDIKVKRLQKQKNKMLCVSMQGTEIIKKKNILFLKSCSNCCEVFLKSGKKMCYSKTLKHVLTKINNDRFIRVHRSFAINLNYISAISSDYTSLTLCNKEVIPISKSQKENFKRILSIAFD